MSAPKEPFYNENGDRKARNRPSKKRPTNAVEFANIMVESTPWDATKAIHVDTLVLQAMEYDRITNMGKDAPNYAKKNGNYEKKTTNSNFSCPSNYYVFLDPDDPFQSYTIVSTLQQKAVMEERGFREVKNGNWAAGIAHLPHRGKTRK